ncbi:hypothetical protein [Parasphingorhabdus sp.]|uniref:hypothetical protein n=1 Tax=Parasphingorhabdus sp. TaxID=2709688 RepID=UPI0030028362
MAYRKAIGRTSDQSAMTRRTAREPEDRRDDQFIFRKKDKMISRRMIGERPRSEGASRNGSTGQGSSGNWTQCGLETEAEKLKRTRGKPPTINAFGPEAGRRTSDCWNRKTTAAPTEAQRELIFG